MHLKTLSFVGFKSFADRTRLVFEPGVTVVVGPNGTGKSNIVDAIAWVMGTQAASSLRSERMDDLIFAGTALRPARGRAEVSLTFDNETGRLPLDLTEVTVTRRLHRDGRSEYEINGTPCRLLDIQELLADGGIGRHQHTIVGQGRVEGVLNAGPEEHRAVIEEAAGVVKHRQRRDRAIRRLEATDLDLQRLQDLLGEQQRRMRPLRRQARAAERYDEARAEWKALRLWLGGERLRTIRARLDRLAATEAEAGEAAAGATRRLADLEGSLESLTTAAGDVGRSLDRDTAAAARLETALERLQRIAMVARERRAGIERHLAGFERQKQDLSREMADLEVQLADCDTQAETWRSHLDRCEIALRALEDEERALAEEQGLTVEGVTARLQGEVAALEAADLRDDRETADTRRRLEVIGERLNEEDSEAEGLNGDIRAADGDLDAARRRYETAAAHRLDSQNALAEAERAAVEAHTALAAAEARSEALESRDALEIEGREGIVGPVMELIGVSGEMAGAVRAALGGWAEAYLISERAALPDAAASVPEGRSAAFLAAGAEVPPPAASSLIEHLDPGPHLELARTLLGDVALVSTWQEGWALVEDGAASRAVTTGGDLVTRHGVRLAGVAASLAAARRIAEQARTASARADSRVTVARRDFDASRGEERVALEALEAIETTISGATEALRLVQRARSESAAEQDRLETRLTALEQGRTARTDRLVELRRRLGAFDGEVADQQAAWESASTRRAAVNLRREEAGRSRDEAAASLAALEERRRLLEQRREDLRVADDALAADPSARGRVERLTLVEDGARTALVSTRRHLGVLRERQRELRSSAGTAGARLEAAHTERDRLVALIAEAREQASQGAVESAELRVREEAEAEALRRDVDADVPEALAAPHFEVPAGIDGWEHAASLQAQIKRLGPVNPLAAAEYRELADRAEFLEEQLADLETSRRELRKVITALDAEIGRLFRGAFAEISERFEENFGLLFPGGTGRLALTDPDDPLVTGVQIHAQPMGKKIGRLSLLSGGERSLAALAFLFAVFRARPSPFYVLDEVEAALDDANLHRFIRLVSTLRDSSQLIIVTHQQQTMQAADLLYGVTMEPGESSRVLTKRLTTADLESA